MPFDASAYGSDAAAILALEGNGWRLMALAQPSYCSAEARTRIAAAGAARLFPGAYGAEAALAGLLLYFGCWTEAHETAQEIATAEGSYWHAMVHRQEPDASNSRYWFRQVGRHPIFPALRQGAAELGVDFGPQWQPEAFIDLCERARQAPGSAPEQQAREVQRLEWQLLFDYCALPRA